MHTPKEIGIVVGPVDDYYADTHALDQASPGFADALSRQAYLFRLGMVGHRANGVHPNMREVPNKVSADRMDVVELDPTHPISEGQRRTALRLLANGNGEQYFVLPSEAEGLHRVFPTPPQNPDEIRTRLAGQPRIGGNASNVALNSMVMAGALHRAGTNMRLHMYSPSESAFAQLVSEFVEQYHGIVHLHDTPDIPVRKGLHIPHIILHEEGRTQTLMLNSSAPTAEQVNETLLAYRSSLHRCCSVYAQDRLQVLSGIQSPLVPTSRAVQSLAIRPQDMLLVNDQELLQLLRNSGNGALLDDHGELLPSCLKPNEQVAALRQNNHVLGRMLTAMEIPGAPQMKTEVRRLAQIGKQDLNCLDVYAHRGHAVAVETSQPYNATRQQIVELTGSQYLSMETENSTGRGDAAAAATMIDHASAETLMKVWKKYSGGEHAELTPAQQSAAQLFTNGVLSRAHAILIHHCHDSHLLRALTPQQYEQLLGWCIGTGIRMAANIESHPTDIPQITTDDRTGFQAALWRVPPTGKNKQWYLGTQATDGGN